MKTRFAVSCCALLLAAFAAAQDRPPVQKLAEGVWACPTENGSNVGWFLLGGEVMVVDAGRDAAAAKQIMKEVAATAGKPVRWVVLTHAHGDHAGGARAFADAGAEIIGQENSAAGILYLLNPAAASGGSAARKTGIVAVADRLMFVGGDRRAEIYWLGTGHTRGDLIVLLPQEKILFSGDLAVNAVLPYMRSQDVDPRGWEQLLPRLAAAPVEKMVPGHGEMGPTAGIGDTLAYLRRVNALATQMIQSRVPDEFVHIELRKPENRIENVPFTDDHVANVKAAIKQETEKLKKTTPAVTPSPVPTARPKG
jgi:glyoxylase-like metal-dependent hydrolase (beta-lactamase superfamily II)